MTEDRCPYCTAEVDICHDDGYGYTEGKVFEQVCWACGKTFGYTASISISHDLFKADCLNGFPHTMKRTCTAPAEYAVMRCTVCDEERDPRRDPQTGDHLKASQPAKEGAPETIEDRVVRHRGKHIVAFSRPGEAVGFACSVSEWNEWAAGRTVIVEDEGEGG